MTQTEKDEKYMRMALVEAREAMERDEVPIGAVVVSPRGTIVGRGHNLTEACRRVGPRRNASHHSRRTDFRRKIPSGLHTVCHRRTVPHVRRGYRVGTGQPYCLRGCRRQARLPHVHIEIALSPTCRDCRRSAGRRMCRADAHIFQIQTLSKEGGIQ